jgi:hypothetical protein
MSLTDKKPELGIHSKQIQAPFGTRGNLANMIQIEETAAVTLDRALKGKKIHTQVAALAGRANAIKFNDPSGEMLELFASNHKS